MFVGPDVLTLAPYLRHFFAARTPYQLKGEETGSAEGKHYYTDTTGDHRREMDMAGFSQNKSSVRSVHCIENIRSILNSLTIALCFLCSFFMIQFSEMSADVIEINGTIYT